MAASLSLRQFAALKVLQWSGLSKAIPSSLSSVDGSRGWWPIIRESTTGAWQTNTTVNLEDSLTHPTVFACVTLIASDIAKLRPMLMQQDAQDIWTETESPAFSPVLRRPNSVSSRISFFMQWVLSKLTRGNTYVLKQRDNRGVVVALYVLDPTRVKVLVAPDGSVFYELKRDDLSRLPEDRVAVPAREIIHDVFYPLYHPLVGIPPLYAAQTTALTGVTITNNSSKFFENGSFPGGILIAPKEITAENAATLKSAWDAGFTGDNVGKVAVLGNDLKYQPLDRMRATDAQLIEQLQWGDEKICSVYHVPPYMVGVGDPPTYNNIEALNQQYYAQCLQVLIESIELLLDEGLELPRPYGVEIDLDALLRMDTPSRVKAAADSIGAGLSAPNEARKRWLGIGPVEGGDTPYLQQQNYALSALARRDAAAPAPSASPSSSASAPAERTVFVQMPTTEPRPPADDDMFEGRFATALLRQMRHRAA